MVHYPAGSTSGRWYTVVIKRWTWSATISGRLWHLNDAQLVLNRPKVCQENTPHTITPPAPAWTVETRQDDPCFHVLYTKFWRYHLNVAAEVETHQTRQRFSNLLLSSFGDPVWIVSSVCCSYLTGAAPGVVFCCWSPSVSGFDMCVCSEMVLCIPWL